jgi:hypothetical protein
VVSSFDGSRYGKAKPAKRATNGLTKQFKGTNKNVYAVDILDKYLFFVHQPLNLPYYEWILYFFTLKPTATDKKTKPVITGVITGFKNLRKEKSWETCCHGAYHPALSF